MQSANKITEEGFIGRRGHAPWTSCWTVARPCDRRRNSYDLAVCDLKMPGMDGQMFYQALVQRHNPLHEDFVVAPCGHGRAAHAGVSGSPSPASCGQTIPHGRIERRGSRYVGKERSWLPSGQASRQRKPRELGNTMGRQDHSAREEFVMVCGSGNSAKCRANGSSATIRSVWSVKLETA